MFGNVALEPILPPITEHLILDFERELGVTLPADYRAFLLQHNGGIPTPECYWINTDFQHNSVRWFYGLGEAPYHFNLVQVWRSYLGRMPSNLVPVGADFAANKLCLAVSDDDVNTIYFWESDAEPMEDEPMDRNLYKLANSFSELLNKLLPCPSHF